MPGERNIYLGTVGLALIIGAAFGNLLTRHGPPADDGQTSTQPGKMRPRIWKRIGGAVIVVWLLLGAAQEALMGRITLAGEQLYRQLELLLPEPASDARIFVVHHSPLNSVGFPQATRLRYGRSDLSGGALTLSPTLLSSTTERIRQTGPDSIRIERTGGFFFDSFVEQFHLFSQPVETLRELGGRFGVKLLSPPATLRGLDTLEFELPYDLHDPRLVILYWENHRIRKVRDLRRIGELSELVMWTPPSE
jgi:hypothetical protein